MTRDHNQKLKTQPIVMCLAHTAALRKNSLELQTVPWPVILRVEWLENVADAQNVASAAVFHKPFAPRL